MAVKLLVEVFYNYLWFSCGPDNSLDSIQIVEFGVCRYAGDVLTFSHTIDWSRFFLSQFPLSIAESNILEFISACLVSLSPSLTANLCLSYFLSFSLSQAFVMQLIVYYQLAFQAAKLPVWLYTYRILRYINEFIIINF